MTEPIRLTPGDRQASQALIDAYAESWQRINDAQLALADDPLNARKRARLGELRDMVSREVRTLDATAQQYIARQYPQVYVDAVTRGAVAVAADATAYVQPQREAAQALADGLERQLLEATQHVDETTKTLIRRIGRDAGLKTAIDGRTAKQAATEMRRILNQSGIHAVTYANGARVGLKTYTEMAIRTSTALALNQGVLQGSVDAGCLHWEVFDGQSCGWTRHNDPDRAHGKVVTRDQALANPIAHPNCRRALGPRPDLGVDRTKPKPPRETVTQQEVAQRADGNTPSVSREPSRGPESRIGAANTRAAAAQARAATSVTRAQTARLPDPTPADADKVYPRYLADLAKIDKRIKASVPPGDVSGPRRRMVDRLAAAEFDPDRASEYDLLNWMQEQAAVEGFGNNLSVPMLALGRHNEARVIRYLSDGGRVPDPVDLKVGTKAGDVRPIYPRNDAEDFWEPDPQDAVGQFEREVWSQVELTPAQSAAIRGYSRGNDGTINKALRNGAADGPRTTAVRAAMRPLSRSIRVRRGVDVDAFGYRAPTAGPGGGVIRDRNLELEYLRGLAGQTIEDRGFLSTSVNPRGAFHADVEMEIDVPEGYRGSWVEPFTSSPGEAEFLLDRGTRLEIYDIIEVGADNRQRGGAAGIARIRARVVYQDDSHDYDPAKARQAAIGDSTPATRVKPSRTEPKIVDKPPVPTKLPPPPAPEAPVKKTPSKPATVDPVGGLPFDVPKRPNGISKAKIDKIGVDGSVYFEDGVIVKPNGMTFKDGQVAAMGGQVRARWAKEIVRLHNEYNDKPNADVPPPAPIRVLAEVKKLTVAQRKAAAEAQRIIDRDNARAEDLAARRRAREQAEKESPDYKPVVRRRKTDLTPEQAAALAEEQRIAKSYGRVVEFTTGRPSEEKLRLHHGDHLHIEGDVEAVHVHLDLMAEKIPAVFHQAFRRIEGDIYMGDGAVPDLDGMGNLRGVTPRGWPPGTTWMENPGAYDVQTRRVLLGNDKHVPSGSTEISLHEGGHGMDDGIGHALGRLDGISNDPEWEAVREQALRPVWNDLNPYFSQEGRAGLSETWAESFAAWTKNRATTGAEGDDSVAEAIFDSLVGPAGRRRPREQKAEVGRLIVDYFEGILRRTEEAAKAWSPGV